jgi:hypothetical protein
VLSRTIPEEARASNEKDFNIPTSSIVLDYDGIGVGIVDRLKCKGFQAGSSALTTKDK